MANLLQGAGRYVDALEVSEKMVKTAESTTGPASRDLHVTGIPVGRL